MFGYLLRRLLVLIPLMLAVSTVVFSLMYLTPGDPVEMMLSQSGASALTVAELRQRLGLQDPLHVQYLRFLGNALHGDLGYSIFSQRPVLETIFEQFPSTVELTITAMFIGVVVGVVLGIISALRENTWIDYLSMVLSIVGMSAPSFWLGLLMIFAFSLTLGWLPATGQGGLERLIMPATVLALTVIATAARMVRTSMLEVLSQEYVVTARAKGLAERVVILRHALQNALIPTMTVLGIQFGQLLAGSIIVETVFARQGIGRLAVTAVLNKDFPLVQGSVLFIALCYALTNIVVDIAYPLIDPRIRYEE